VTINNSNIYAYNKDPVTNTEGVVEATGVEMTNGGKLLVVDSNIKAYAFESVAEINDSGIAYGIHSDGSYDSRGNGVAITIQGESTIIGIGQGGNNDSGNGYGILVGSNNKAIDATNSAVEAEPISNNHILVTGGSEVIGQGSGAVGENSGNGYGVIIGYGDLTITDQSYLDMSLKDNHITVSGLGTQVKGQGDGFNGDSGNGYGVVIGYGSAVVIADNENSDNNDLSIKNSYLTISGGSVISGIGKMSDMDTDEDYAGRGIGVLIGFGYAGWLHFDPATPQYNDFTIGGTGDKSVISITNSTLNSTSENLGVNQSQLSGEAILASPNVGYGLLIGYGGTFDGNLNGDINNTHGVKNMDDITLSGDYFNTTVLGVGGTDYNSRSYGYGMSAAVGVEIGNYTSSSTLYDDSNQVTINDDHFKAYTEGYPSQTAETQYSAGFYMPSGSGTIKTNSENGNSFFYRYGYLGASVDDSYGYGLLGPTRSSNPVSWTPKGSGQSEAFDVFQYLYILSGFKD
jgi:hypothetical protein